MRKYDRLRKEAASCQRCDLYKDANQTVFGEGDLHPSLVLIGETPGDREDVEGHPFVGPAGRVLDRALEDSGIDRERIYLTNAVKHFKFTHAERGKRRLHKTPNRTEIVACRPWLEAELDLLKPDVVLCMGAVAAKSLLGPSFKVTEERGKPLDTRELPDDWTVVATVHPASVLRADNREQAYSEMLADFKVVAKMLTVSAGR